jgi:hypothetical protein
VLARFAPCSATARKNAWLLDLFTTLPWELLCAEVAKLKIELRTGKILVLPKVGSGGADEPLPQSVLHHSGLPSNDATSQNKSAERLSGEGGIRTRGPLSGPRA